MDRYLLSAEKAKLVLSALANEFLRVPIEVDAFAVKGDLRKLRSGMPLCGVASRSGAPPGLEDKGGEVSVWRLIHMAICRSLARRILACAQGRAKLQ